MLEMEPCRFTKKQLSEIFKIHPKDSDIDTLLEMLKTYPLDPTNEQYGNFVHEWVPAKKIGWTEGNSLYKGCTCISGNFYGVAYPFRIITDDQLIIQIMTNAIRSNQNTDAYKAAMNDLMCLDNRKKLLNLLFVSKDDQLLAYLLKKNPHYRSRALTYDDCYELVNTLTYEEMEEYFAKNMQ